MAAKVVLVVLASVLSMACTSSVVGTGEPTPGSGGDAPRTESNGGPSSDPSSSDPGDGVPDSIAALFSPPASTSVTPDDISGLWVSTDNSWTYDRVEARLKISSSSVIFAAKCKYDSEIVHVEVTVRASSSKLTLLEAKTARFSGSCSESIELSAGEWKECTLGTSQCFSVRDTALSLYVTGLPSTWVKLSD